MSIIRKLASQTAVYGLSSVIGRVVIWALTPVYTAMMSQSEYGIFSDLYSFVTYFLVILTFGMETSYFRYASDKKEVKGAYTQAFLLIFFIAIAFSLLSILAHKPLAEILGYAARSELVLMVIAIIGLDVIVALPMAKMRYDERPGLFAGVTIFSILLNLALNAWFYIIMKRTEADYVFISNLITSVARVCILVLLSLPFLRKADQEGKSSAVSVADLLPVNFKLNKEIVFPMMQYGFFIMIAGLFGMINQNSDVNFIKRIWGENRELFNGKFWNGDELAGIFAANKKLAIMILLFTQAFRYAAEPFFFKQSDRSDSRIVFAKVFHYFMMAGIIVYLFVGSFSHELVSVSVFGFQLIDESYHSGLGVVPLLLFGFLLWGAYINISIWFKITKQVRFGLLFSGIGTAIVVLFNIILIPFMGYYASALAMIACYATMTAMVYISGQKYF